MTASRNRRDYRQWWKGQGDRKAVMRSHQDMSSYLSLSCYFVIALNIIPLHWYPWHPVTGQEPSSNLTFPCLLAAWNKPWWCSATSSRPAQAWLLPQFQLGSPKRCPTRTPLTMTAMAFRARHQTHQIHFTWISEHWGGNSTFSPLFWHLN